MERVSGPRVLGPEIKRRGCCDVDGSDEWRLLRGLLHSMVLCKRSPCVICLERSPTQKGQCTKPHIERRGIHARNRYLDSITVWPQGLIISLRCKVCEEDEHWP